MEGIRCDIRWILGRAEQGRAWTGQSRAEPEQGRASQGLSRADFAAALCLREKGSTKDIHTLLSLVITARSF